MNAYDWGGFPGEDDDYDEHAEQDAYERANDLLNDDHWNQMKEGGR
jgi:hypothetical protein